MVRTRAGSICVPHGLGWSSSVPNFRGQHGKSKRERSDQQNRGNVGEGRIENCRLVAHCEASRITSRSLLRPLRTDLAWAAKVGTEWGPSPSEQEYSRHTSNKPHPLPSHNSVVLGGRKAKAFRNQSTSAHVTPGSPARIPRPVNTPRPVETPLRFHVSQHREKHPPPPPRPPTRSVCGDELLPASLSFIAHVPLYHFKKQENVETGACWYLERCIIIGSFSGRCP